MKYTTDSSDWQIKSRPFVCPAQFNRVAHIIPALDIFPGGHAHKQRYGRRKNGFHRLDHFHAESGQIPAILILAPIGKRRMKIDGSNSRAPHGFPSYQSLPAQRELRLSGYQIP
jgi:hypothetical protein